MPHDYFVTWSLSSEISRWRGGRFVLHAQNETDARTLCGIDTGGYWGFAFHDGWDAVNCKRCRKYLTLLRTEFIQNG